MITEQILDGIRRHFSAFADPATTIDVTDRSVRWRQNREEREVTLIGAKAGIHPRVLFKGREYEYRDFFASEHMSDLRALAETIERITPEVADYHDAEAIVEWGEEPGSHVAGPGVSALTSACTEKLPFLATRIVFLRGAAGAGKTALLRTLSRDRASAFRLGKADRVFLYVDAQGRALARLDEALAYVLQDLKAVFTYHAVPVLVELGLVIPIVDGFDELLGVGGYNEAFSSLADFIVRLQAQGVVVTSSRATFYDFSRLNTLDSVRRYDRPGPSSGGLRSAVVAVRMQGWSRPDLDAYASRKGVKSSEITVLLDKLHTNESDPRYDPFFVTRAAELLLGGEGSEASPDVLGGLILSFLRREADKLRRQDRTQILSVEQHLDFLQMLSEEMWMQEVREIDRATVEALTEMLGEEVGLKPDELRVLRDRISAHALLDRSSDGSKVSFQHEYYFAYCLAEQVVRALAARPPSMTILTRGTLSPVVADEVVVRSGGEDSRLRQVLDGVQSRGGISFTKEVVDRNAGEIVSAVIRKRPVALRGRVVMECALANVDLSHTRLADVRFLRVTVAGANLVGVQWSGISFDDCKLDAVSLDVDSSRLEADGLLAPGTVTSVLLVSDHGTDAVYAPDEVASILAACGAKQQGAPLPEEAGPRPHLELCRRFLRMMTRTWCFSEGDLEERGLSRRAEWAPLHKLLQKHELVREERISKKGPHPVVQRLSIPVAVLREGERGDASDDQVAAFWRDLAALDES